MTDEKTESEEKSSPSLRTCENCGRTGDSGFWWPHDMGEDGRLYLCNECMATMSCDGPDADRFLWDRWKAWASGKR